LRAAIDRAYGNAGSGRHARARLILYAIPTPLGGGPAHALPAHALRTVQTLRDFVVENAKSARAFLAAVGMHCAIRELNITPLEHDAAPLLQPLREGRALGLVSEADCPAIAVRVAARIEAA